MVQALGVLCALGVVGEGLNSWVLIIQSLTISQPITRYPMRVRCPWGGFNTCWSSADTTLLDQ